MENTTKTVMTMADAGAIQLDEQERWFAAHPACDIPTDDLTDEFISKELRVAEINTCDYESEFGENTFRDAVNAGMDAWFAEVSE